jgi:hypothetical protein
MRESSLLSDGRFQEGWVVHLKVGSLEGKRIFGLLSVLLMACLLFSPSPAARAEEREILVIHTNNVTGYLFPCPT